LGGGRAEEEPPYFDWKEMQFTPLQFFGLATVEP